MTAIPRIFTLEPIDDAARNGSYQLLFSGETARGGEFAIARWWPDGWTVPSGRPLDFEPEKYRP